LKYELSFINVVYESCVDRNVANNQFTGWIPNELKNIGNLE